MAQYTSNQTISNTFNLDSQSGVTDPHIFDISSGVTVTIDTTLISAVGTKLIKRGEGTLRFDTDQNTSLKGGYQLEAGTIDANNRWLSTYLGDDTANGAPTSAFVADFFDLRGGTLDFSTWNTSAVQGRLFSHADQGVTLTSGTTTLKTNPSSNGGTQRLNCHVTCNGGTLNYTQTDYNGDLEIHGNLLGSRFIRSGDGSIEIKGQNNALTQGLKIEGGQIQLERHLGPNPTSLVSNYIEFAGAFSQKSLSDHRRSSLRLREWAGPGTYPTFPDKQGWTVSGYGRINLQAVDGGADAAYSNQRHATVNGPVVYANGIEKYLRFYTTGSGGAHIAFRGGVSGNASGDNSGMFINDTNNYVYVHAQSDINLPNAVFSGKDTAAASGNEGSLWVKGGGRAKFRKLLYTTWLETNGTTADGAAVIDFAAIENTTGSNKSVERFEFNASINHIYLPSTAPLNTIGNTSITGIDSGTTEIGGSFTYAGSLNGIATNSRTLFVDGTIKAKHFDQSQGTFNTIFTISPTSTSKIDIDSAAPGSAGSAGHAIFNGNAMIRPKEAMTYYPGGVIATANVSQVSGWSYTYSISDPSSFLPSGTTFSGTRTTGAGGAVTLASSLPTAAPTYTLTSSSSAVNEGSSVTLSLRTTGVADNTSVPFTISGTNVAAADFSNISSLTGHNFTIVNNGLGVTGTSAGTISNNSQDTSGQDILYVILADGLTINSFANTGSIKLGNGEWLAYRGRSLHRSASGSTNATVSFQLGGTGGNRKNLAKPAPTAGTTVSYTTEGGEIYGRIAGWTGTNLDISTTDTTVTGSSTTIANIINALPNGTVINVVSNSTSDNNVYTATVVSKSEVSGNVRVVTSETAPSGFTTGNDAIAFEYVQGPADFKLDIATDMAENAGETVNVSLNSPLTASTSFTINNTSAAASAAWSSDNLTSITAEQSSIFVATITGSPATLPYTINPGTGLTAAELGLTSFTGNATPNGNEAEITITPTSSAVGKTFTITMFGTTSPSVSITAATSYALSVSPASIEVGDTATVTLTINNFVNNFGPPGEDVTFPVSGFSSTSYNDSGFTVNTSSTGTVTSTITITGSSAGTDTINVFDPNDFEMQAGLATVDITVTAAAATYTTTVIKGLGTTGTAITEVNEGQDFSSVIIRSAAPTSTETVYWAITGLELADITGFTKLNGSATIPSGQTRAAINIPTASDNLTEGDQTAVVTWYSDSARTMVLASSSTIVRDTSLSPSYTIPTTANVNEGSTLTLAITAANNPSAKSLTYNITNVTGSFVTNSTGNTISIPANQATTNITIPTIDSPGTTTGGSFTVDLLDGATTIDTTTVTVNNVNLVYTLTNNVSDMANEGQTFTVTLGETNNRFPSSGTVNYTITGVNETDFTPTLSSLTGSFDPSTSAGRTKTFVLANDFLQENTETFVLTLNAHSSVSTSITIGDTSTNTADHTVPSTGSTIEIPEDQTRNLTGVISGTGNITKTGNGILRLSGNNTFTGSIIVSAGAIEITNNNSLGAVPATARNNHVTLNTGTKLIANGTSKLTIHENHGITLSGNANIENHGSSIDINSNITGGSNSVTFDTTSNQIRVIRLRGNNTYTGNTTVNRNITLDINPINQTSNALTSSITNSGDIRGKGTVNGNLTITGTGRLLPGAEIDSTLNVTGNVTLNAGSTTYISYTDTGADQLATHNSGNITVAGTLYLYPQPGATNTGTFNHDILKADGTLTGTFANVVNYKDNLTNNGIDNITDTNYPSVNYATAKTVKLIKS